ERESQKHEQQGNQEECRAFHSGSFRSECMVRDSNAESKTRDRNRVNTAKELAEGGAGGRERTKSARDVICYARSRVAEGEDADAGPAKFHEDMLGDRAGGNPVSRGVMGAGASTGRDE